MYIILGKGASLSVEFEYVYTDAGMQSWNLVNKISVSFAFVNLIFSNALRFVCNQIVWWCIFVQFNTIEYSQNYCSNWEQIEITGQINFLISEIKK